MSGQEREMEEDEGEGTSDTALMLPRRPPDCQAAALRSPRWGGLAAQGLGILLLPGRALAGLLLHLLLPAAVFLLVLLPAAAIVFLGFLCHSRACQESGAETRATEEKVSPAGGTYRRASRSDANIGETRGRQRGEEGGAPPLESGLNAPPVHPEPRPACRALLSDRGSAALIVSGFLSLPPLLVLASAARARLARRLRSLLPPPTCSPGPRRHLVSSDDGRERHHPDGEEQLCAWV
ncbi:Transmembrane protein 88B [Camelus dromedarius]|uniref:Transmembrane protein 88B n=1 Tax=Camelus dromedarius TaxID=9838 RepID=A0A5N4DBB1_CAMDR|nr:Transmembrane protein 88B [Camelus dromedarius]